MIRARRTPDPDANHVPAMRDPREVKTGQAYAAMRDHPAAWITAVQETWELDVWAGRWHRTEPAAECPTLTMDEFDVYREACIDEASFRSSLEVEDWRKTDAEIHDRDDWPNLFGRRPIDQDHDRLVRDGLA